MTTTTAEFQTRNSGNSSGNSGSAGPSAPAPVRRAAAGRMATAVILVVALIASSSLQMLVSNRQETLVRTPGAVKAKSSLGNMDTFALALLLGGLRGPLVMALWPAIESQKNEHNLEDIDTMIEWVRRLQPEFDSVHMFQIWNKAYNISALMVSPANKYTVIMESLDYAASVDRERPGDLNILSQTANVYGGKLGASALPEFPFYTRQFREESLTDANREAAFPEYRGKFVRLDKWKPLLDDHNNILADLLKPAGKRPADLAQEAPWNDGSELQYLTKFQPFTYGLSPLAMSYNYAKRAEVALNSEFQKPIQFTAMVIDSQPAVQLKLWTEDDMRRGRKAEATAFGVSAPSIASEPMPEIALAAIKLSDVPQDPASINAAIYYYGNVVNTSAEAIKEYKRHTGKPEYAVRLITTYRSHIADMEGMGLLAAADRDYLLAMLLKDPARAAERKQLLTSAKASYEKARLSIERSTLQFYAEDYGLFGDPNKPGSGGMPAGTRFMDKRAVFQLRDEQIPEVYKKTMMICNQIPFMAQEHRPERSANTAVVSRCDVRLAAIEKALTE